MDSVQCCIVTRFFVTLLMIAAGIYYHEDGAASDGWSHSKVTNVGSAGTVHGPWGSDVRLVSTTVSIPARREANNKTKGP